MATKAAKPQGGLKDIAEGRTDIYNVDPRLVQVKEGFNSRDFNDPENIAHVDELAQSIAEVGVKRPLKVYMEDGVIYLTDGECRLRGAMRAIEHYGAELKTIPVIPEPRHASEADRVFSQIVENSGKGLKPLEMANVFARLMNLGWDEKAIAKKSGKSEAWVKELLSLYAAPEELKKLVSSGEVSATLAAETVKSEGGKAATKKLKEAVKEAKAKGKTKATKKDVTPRPKKPKKTASEIERDAPSEITIDDIPEELLASIRKTAFGAGWRGYHDAEDGETSSQSYEKWVKTL